MSEDAKKIVTVVAGAVTALGLAVLTGAWLVRGHTTHEMSYRETTKQVYPDPTVFPTVVGKGTPGLDLAGMIQATPQAVSDGKKIFGTYCTACHGAEGKGDGPAAGALKPVPRNFTDSHGWTQGYTLADLYISVSEGVKGTGMGAFSMLSPADRFALAHYIESIGHFDHHDRPAEEIAEIDARYHLSEGTHAPNKVAVPTVMNHEEEEFAAPPPIVMPLPSDTSVEAALCRRLVADPVRAAEVLSQVADWRVDLDVFAGVVMAGTPRNGFRPAAATLDRTQWQVFHDEIARRTPHAGSSRTDSAKG